MTRESRVRGRNGRFGFSGDADRRCVCGRRLAVHDAVPPHPFGDALLEEDDVVHPDCDGFRLARPPRERALAPALAKLEVSMILLAVDRHSGNIAKAARSLGMARRTLDRRIVELGLRAGITAKYPRTARQPKASTTH